MNSTKRIAGFKPLPLLLSVLTGYLLYLLLPLLIYTGWAANVKLSGRAAHCDWKRIAMFYPHLRQFETYVRDAQVFAGTYRADPELPIGRLEAPWGEFWIRSSSEGPGVAWLLAEHRWMAEHAKQRMVRPGDTVFDIGAHVGLFVRTALDQGAAKVVAVEPDPYSVICLRRNFAAEISAGRVVIVEAGAWSQVDTMTLYLGADPGWNSMVEKQSGGEILVPVLPLDDMVAQLELSRVDFIKMDIEGAEKQALRGAKRTLQRFRPRLMIDTYQWAHDLDGLVAEVHAGSSVYRPICGPCEPTQTWDAIIPHMTFYEPGS